MEGEIRRRREGRREEEEMREEEWRGEEATKRGDRRGG